MAYVKNVTNETAISGAFLNSDDTGLTTNIFLTNPRLFGVSVTKHWSGLNTLGGFGARGSSGPWPVTLELGGMVPRIDAPNATLSPSFASEFDSTVGRGDQVQHQGLGWGQGRELGLSWRPDNGPWRLSLNYRQGHVRDSHEAYQERWTDPVCAWVGSMYAAQCTNPAAPPVFAMLQEASKANYVLSAARRHERYTLFDLGVSRQLGSGDVLRSELGVTTSAGYRWERYINAIDGGHHQRQREDRTIDGPTLKLRVDFGY